MNSYRAGRHQRRITRTPDRGPTMYCDKPAIASEPIYTGPPTDLTLEDDVGEVRVWDDDDGSWIDAHWHRDGDTLEFLDSFAGSGCTVRVVEMRPAGERKVEDNLDGYGDA